MSNKNDIIDLEGVITADLKGDFFMVKIDSDKFNHEVKCTYSGKLKKSKIKLLVGDRVAVEVSPYNLCLGRITYRYK